MKDTIIIWLITSILCLAVVGLIGAMVKFLMNTDLVIEQQLAIAIGVVLLAMLPVIHFTKKKRS